MRFFRVGFLFATAMSVATSALGAAGAITPQVTPLTSPVTYSANSSPPLETYVAYTLNFTNTGGNTINDARFTFVATATDTAETVALFNPAVYLPAGCAQTGVNSFACTKRQLQAGESFFTQPIVVFFRAPVKVVGGLGDAPGTDFVNVGGDLVYAEGTSGKNPPPNSATTWTGPQVSLGTDNPVNIKSAVPKTGAKVFTGQGGVPVPATPEVPKTQFAELLNIPSLPGAHAVAEIVVDTFTDPNDVANCMNGGRFIICPAFTTSVVNNGVETRFLDPLNPLTLIYRIDASNNKLSPTKLLNSVSITYSGKKYDPDTGAQVGNWSNEEIPKVCVNNQPRKDGLPCVLNSRCFKKNDTGGIPALENDCEWTTVNTGNGLIKIQ